MGTFAWTQGASGLALGGAAAVGAVVVGLYASGAVFPTSDPDAGQGALERDAKPEQNLSIDTTEAADAPTGTVPDLPEPPANMVEDKAEDAPAPAVPEVSADPDVPTFDIVRVSPDGQTLVAGAARGATSVRVILDGADVGVAEVDDAGKFVAFLDLPNSDQPRVVSLMADGDGGPVESLDQIILAPSVAAVEDSIAVVANDDVSASDQAETAVASDTDGPAIAGNEAGAALAEVSPSDDGVTQSSPGESVALFADEDMSTTLEPAPADTGSDGVDVAVAMPAPDETVTAPPSVAVEPDTIEAPTVILSTRTGVEVLQSPGGAPEVLDQIALDAITYENAGQVALSGRGVVDEFVRIYIDNEPVQTTEVTSDGRWRANLPNVDGGTYTLRVDGVDAKAVVRVDTVEAGQ